MATRWSFDPDDFSLQYDGFIVGSMRDQYDTEDADTEDGDGWDNEMRDLGRAIVTALNFADVRWPEYEKDKGAVK